MSMYDWNNIEDNNCPTAKAQYIKHNIAAIISDLTNQGIYYQSGSSISISSHDFGGNLTLSWIGTDESTGKHSTIH